MKSIKLRVCRIGDAKFILDIYNFATKSGFFLSKKTVKFQDHFNWLKGKLNSNNAKIYIALIGGRKIGYIRFQKVIKKNYEVSIGNKSNFYGKGLGTVILGLAIKKFIKSYKPKKIFSTIKKSNKRSEKCFLNNQFIKIKKNKKKASTKINLKNVNYFEYKFN